MKEFFENIAFFDHIKDQFILPLQNPVLIFSLILMIILLAPLLLKRMSIPGIIGLIISGVIIGPHGFGILANDSAIKLFSTIGLLYIMFQAGLELDMNQFKINRNKSLTFGLFTFILPLVLGFPVCYYLLGYDFNASFLTASMFATHTLVAYPIVSKFGISKNQAVAITVGGTILTDTAVLIMLAVIMGNNAGTLNQDFWIRLGVSLTLFSLIMFYVIPRIAKWFFSRLESEKHSHYIFVLAVIFFAAFLAEAAGVEKIIGAFVAGLALNKLIPHSSPLMNRIEFIGNSLFIPFFLISVGMLVDVSVLLNGPTALIVAGTLTLFALFSKWLAALVTQLIFKYSRAQRQLIFGLSSSHAAATLAIILVGYNEKILDENILNGTIILILVTCLVASFATEQAAKKIVLASETNHEDISTKTDAVSEHILIPSIGNSDISKLIEFSTLIKEPKSVNPISILSVVLNDEEAEQNVSRARKKMEDYAQNASATETKLNMIATIDHNQASGISRTCREIMADVIILQWPEKTGLAHRFMGERMENLLNNVDKTIFICDFEKPFIRHKRLLIFMPPFSEKETGFKLWLDKLTKLAKELSLTVTVFSNEASRTAVQKQIVKAKLGISVQYHDFADWDDFLIISREIKSDDIIALISTRRGSISYEKNLENIPSKVDKHFKENTKIVIFPQQNYLCVEHGDFANPTLSAGIETVQKIGKGIGNIFKKDEGEKD
jgi:Kef-type K+ transport system membrane component KefB